MNPPQLESPNLALVLQSPEDTQAMIEALEP